MLFELGGKRKRFIQVIYVFLALLLGVGLVGLGIGGDANGGIFNALGIGGDDATQTNPEFDNQIERAEAVLVENPDDEQALTTLAQVHFLAGQTGLERDPTTNQVVGISEESITEYNLAIESWERYLATKPQDPDDEVAGLMIQAYANSTGTDSSATATEAKLEGAFTAAQIVAEARPSSGTLRDLSTYAYLANEVKIAEQARKDSLAEAADSTTRSQIKGVLDQAEAQGKLIQKQLSASAPSEEQLENPLGDLGSGTAPLPGGAAPLPGGGAPLPGG